MLLYMIAENEWMFIINPPLRMRRAGYTVVVCHVVCAALADETFSTIETGINTK